MTEVGGQWTWFWEEISAVRPLLNRLDPHGYQQVVDAATMARRSHADGNLADVPVDVIVASGGNS